MRLRPFSDDIRCLDLLAWAAVLAMALLLGFRHLFDADIFYHIANGREILAQGEIPLSNTLVWAQSERSFYPNPAWLFGVVLALVERSAGLTGIILVKTAAVVGLFAILYRLCRREGAGPLLTSVLLFIVGMGAAFRFAARPHLFSLLFFTLCLLLLSKSKKQSSVWLWLLPPLFIFWANIHSGFILGLILLATYLAGEILNSGWNERRAAIKRLTLVFALCLVATFITPQPLTNYLFLAQLLEPRSYPITEYFAPTFGAHPWFYVTAAVLALWAVWRRARPRDWTWLLPGCIFLILAFYAARFIPFFLLAAVPWVLSSRVGPVQFQPLEHLPAILKRGGSVLLIIALPAVIYLWSPVSIGLGFGVEPSAAPLGSVRFLKEVQITDRLYNSQSLGGLGAMYLSPHYRMYQTAYFQVEKDRIEEAYLASKSPLDWQSFLDRYAIHAVWLDITREPFSLDYYPAENWALVYYDDFSAVFLRRQGLNPAVVSAYEYRIANPLLLAKITGNDSWEDPFVVATGVAEARRALIYTQDNRVARTLLAFFLARRPGEETAALAALDELGGPDSQAAAAISFEKGRIFYRMERFAEAEEAFAGYVALVHEDPEGYFELARSLIAAGQKERAQQVLQEMTGKFPNHGRGYLLLGNLLLQADDLNATWTSLSRARELLPTNAEVPNLLGIVKAQQGEMPAAIDYFQQALTLDPAYESARLNLQRALRESGGVP